MHKPMKPMKKASHMDRFSNSSISMRLDAVLGHLILRLSNYVQNKG